MARAADTYRQARRNAARGEIWGPSHYHPSHDMRAHRRWLHGQPKPNARDRSPVKEGERMLMSVPKWVRPIAGILSSIRRYQGRGR